MFPQHAYEYVAIDQDHHEICQSLRNLNDRDLLNIGVTLGLSYTTLETMKNVPEEMVAAWLNRRDNVLSKSGEPTWAKLIEALKEIGHTGIAQDILKTKCGGSDTTYHQQTADGAVADDSTTGVVYIENLIVMYSLNKILFSSASNNIFSRASPWPTRLIAIGISPHVANSTFNKVRSSGSFDHAYYLNLYRSKPNYESRNGIVNSYS